MARTSRMKGNTSRAGMKRGMGPMGGGDRPVILGGSAGQGPAAMPGVG